MSVFGVILVRIFPVFSCIWTSIAPYSVRMRENTGNIRTRITPNTDTCYAVYKEITSFNSKLIEIAVEWIPEIENKAEIIFSSKNHFNHCTTAIAYKKTISGFCIFSVLCSSYVQPFLLKCTKEKKKANQENN